MIDVSSLKGLTQDSRAVEPGFLFAAFKGEISDGRDYIPAAIEKGATHILAQQDTTLPDGANAQLITSDNPRKTFAHLVAQFYPDQPETIVAVTGTNGKTSIVNFVEQIWRSLGYSAASIGTLQGGMTTADPVALHKTLTKLKADGITHLAMEASSHGLHQYRLDGTKIKAAGFTNLSRDHLDYHKDMDDYLAAKSRLFTEVMEQDGIAIINADTPETQKLKPQIKSKIWTYGRAGDDLQILSLEPTTHGQNCELKIINETYRLEINLVGEFQISNALCALALVLSQDGADKEVDKEKAIQSLQNLHGARGRMELVEGHPSGAAIYVDYAHTPDALKNILTALRPHAQNKLICLFGCGGDRDKGKRSEMGKIASDLADKVIITDDNPRSEDPASIRAAILTGASSAPEITKEIAGRRDAIHQTIKTLKHGDILVIAGKGHEQGQIFADRTDPFDDVTQAKQAIKNL